jgi:hypothetical protein
MSVSGDVAKTGPFVAGEDVKTSDGKAGAANCEVAAQGPIRAKRDQVVVHGRRP